MAISSKELAQKLNLSPAAVSMALNNKPGVSEKTRRKIFDYIEEVTGEAERQKEEKITVALATRRCILGYNL